MNRIEIPYTVMLKARQRFLYEHGIYDDGFSPIDSGSSDDWVEWLSDMGVHVASEVSTPGYTYVYYCCTPEDYTLFLLKAA